MDAAAAQKENHENESKIRKVHWGRLIFAVFSVSLGSFYLGATIAYPSSALLTLSNPDSTVYVAEDSDEETWIGSLTTLASVPGALLTGSLADKFGRKPLFLVTCLPAAIAWALVAAAQNIWMLYAGRIVMGLAVGIFIMLVPVYVAEVSPSHLRGLFGASFGFQAGLGVLVINALGNGLDWKWIAVVCLAIPIAMFVFIWFIPETPYFLTFRNRIEEAKRSRNWFFESDESEEDHETPSSPVGFLEMYKGLAKRRIVHPLILCTFVMFFQQWSGLYVILTYQTRIDSGNLNPAQFTTITGVAALVFGFPFAFLLDKAGRRIFLILSGLIQAAGLVIVAVYYNRLDADADGTKQNLNWLPMLGVLTYFAGNSVGYATIPWVLNSEYFHTENRALSGGITAALNNLFGFASTKTFDVLKHAFGDSGFFLFYAAVSFVSSIFVFFFVVESRKKSLEEISADFENGDILQWPRCGSKKETIRDSEEQIVGKY